MNDRNFIYKNKSYPFDLNLFSTHSSYFSTNNVSHYHNISLLSAYEYRFDLSDESITTFIKFIHNQRINITNSNVLSINFLSNKYNIKKLIEITNKYIRKHYKEIIDQFLSLQNKDIQKQSNLSQIEEIISNNFFDFISDDRLLIMPTMNLYRIISKFYSNTKSNDTECVPCEMDQRIIEFIFKYIERNGIDSSILFTLIEINDQNVEYLCFMISRYSKVLDFRFIDPTLFQFVNSILNRQKIKETNILNSIEKIKKEQEKREKQLKELINQQQTIFQKQISFIFDNLGQLKFPKDITTIKEGEFSAFMFKEIVIPSTVKKIESNAFSQCSLLTQITIPSSVTSIGPFAFSNCTSLLQVIVPSSVKKIEKGTFLNCSSLIRILVHSSLESIENDSFLGCTSLEKFLIYFSEHDEVSDDKDNFLNFSLKGVNFNDNDSIQKVSPKFNLFLKLLNGKLLSEKSSVLLENDLYLDVIQLISELVSNPDKKLISALFSLIRKDVNIIDFVDSIFPYNLLNKTNLSKISYWLPLSKAIMKKEIYLSLTINDEKITFNDSSSCDFSFDLILNEKESLSLSEESRICYSLTTNKKSMSIKSHTDEENDKLDFIFYSMVSELIKDPSKSYKTTEIKQTLSKTKHKIENEEIQFKTNNSILSLKNLFKNNQISIISSVWNIVFMLPENVIFELSKIIHPIDSKLLLSSFFAYKNLNEEIFVNIIKWSEWASEIDSSIPILYKYVSNPYVNQMVTNSNFDELIYKIKEEIHFLQHAPMEMKDFWNSDDLIDNCKNIIAQIIEKKTNNYN